MTVRELIRMAYGVRDYQIERSPQWIGSLRFDITAKSATGSTKLEDLNRTGLSGEYGFQLDFTPDSGPCRAAADGQSGSAASDLSGAPTLYTDVQPQLGLKLESSKGPVEILVIDRVAKPSEN